MVDDSLVLDRKRILQQSLRGLRWQFIFHVEHDARPIFQVGAHTLAYLVQTNQREAEIDIPSAGLKGFMDFGIILL